MVKSCNDSKIIERNSYDAGRGDALSPSARDAQPDAPRESERIYGYARVSARDQNLGRQLDALRSFPVSEGNIFRDRASGRDFKRPGYRRLVKRVKPGDVVVIKSIDRLGRNYSEILHEWRVLTQERRIAIVVLDMPLLDTRSTGQDVTGVFLADMMLQLLSYVAQIERENTHQRQAEGIRAARARGVRFGRPAIPKPPCWEQVRIDYLRGDVTRADAARRLGVCTRTFDKWMGD